MHLHFADTGDMHALQADRDRVEQTEHQTRAQRAIGPPLAEDQRRQSDVALTRVHVAAEPGILGDRPIGVGDPRPVL
jgi:hypothetical protein